MTVAKPTTKCPFCKETIMAGATKCKHCQSDLSEVLSRKKSFFSRFNTFRNGFIVGVLLTLTLVILLYLQCRSS